MSTKTLRKRIALVAVSALAAGLVSVAPASAASTATSPEAGSSNITTVENVLAVGTKATVTGSVVTSSVTETWHASTPTNNNRSLGLLYKDASTGTAQSATVLATGGLAFYTNATTATVVASGGTISSVVTNDVDAPNTRFSATGLKFFASSAAAINIGFKWSSSTPGTYTISLFTGGTSYLYPDAGTLTGQIVVTVAAAGVSGVYSAADSKCNLATSATGAALSDATGAALRKDGEHGFVTVALKDAYGVALDAGALVATATNGAYVYLSLTDTSAGVGSTSVYASEPTNVSAVVTQPTAHAPLSTTVTITYNGTVVCTKSLVIAGETASIKVSNVKSAPISNSGAASATHFYVQNLDAAGNVVIPTTNAAQFTVDSATVNTFVTAASIGQIATFLGSTTTASVSTGTFTCGGSAGSANLALKYLNPSGTTVKSAPFTARCAGDPYTYKATWDKASYVQGEIATLSVQFFDSKGNKANSLTTGNTATVTAPMLTLVGSIADAAKADENGVIKLTYTVGTTTGITAGSYNALVNYPTLVDDVKQSIVTAKYTVADAGGTSNAAILKAIVSLIASINKQIALLQKALLKK